MIFRQTAPNWERPSPDYGSHIIMSISGIYLLISIHTLYHSQVVSLIQVHEITYFNHTLCLLKYTSAPFSSLAPTDSSRRTLSISIIFFTVYRGLITGGHLYTPYHGHWSAANCTQRLRTGTSPDISVHVQQPSLLNIDLHSTIREQQVQTSNILSTDKYNPVRVTHQIHVKHLKCYTTPPPSPPQHKRALNKEQFEVKPLTNLKR